LPVFGLVCNMPSHLSWSPSRGIHGYLLFEIMHLTVRDSSYDCNLLTRDQHQLALIPPPPWSALFPFHRPSLRLYDLVVNCHIFGLVCNMPSLLPWFPSRGIHGHLLFEILHLTVLDSSYDCNLLTRYQHWQALLIPHSHPLALCQSYLPLNFWNYARLASTEWSCTAKPADLFFNGIINGHWYSHGWHFV
jgi:hypothetical protein